MDDFIRLGIADERDQIIFGEDYDGKKYPGGVRRFDELTLEQIKQLEEMDILDMADRQNESPSIGKMIEFLRSRTTDGWYAHGYCVSADRSDFRITFEGVGKKSPPSMEDVDDFTGLFLWADEFYVGEDGLRCWYD